MILEIAEVLERVEYLVLVVLRVALETWVLKAIADQLDLQENAVETASLDRWV